jgi:hypothetical protein
LSFKNQSIKPDNVSMARTNKFTVYDEFGLINDSIGKNNSKSKSKYREDRPKYR